MITFTGSTYIQVIMACLTPLLDETIPEKMIVHLEKNVCDAHNSSLHVPYASDKSNTILDAIHTGHRGTNSPLRPISHDDKLNWHILWRC
jgi:hypothetical protein